MKDFIETIKNYLAFLFRKPKTNDDRLVKRYDLLLFIGATFLIIYTSFFFLNVQHSVYESSASVVDIGMNANEQHPLITPSPTVGYAIATTPDTLVLKTNQFYVGEVVGIRYFGIFGIVREKILGTGGYKYQVRWRDTSHGLPTDEFFSWELYRPERGSVPASVLLP